MDMFFSFEFLSILSLRYLTSLLNYVLSAPSGITRFCVCASCMPLHLTSLADVPYLRALRILFTHLARLICVLCSLYLQVLFSLVWICSIPKTLKFPRTIKSITNCSVFMPVERQS